MRSWITLAALIVAGWLGSAAVQAQQAKTARTVQDDLGLFSADAKAKANAEIARIKQAHHKDLVIETTHPPKQPANLDFNDTAAVERFIDDWTKTKFKNEQINGVYVVFIKESKLKEIRVYAGPETMKSGLFTNQNCAELLHKIQEKMKAGDKDEALLTATSYVADTMQHNGRAAVNAAPPGNTPAAQPGGQTPVRHQAETSPIIYWVLIGLGILLVFWLISAVLRGFSAMRGGGGGGGPGYGYGGGGGGGSGFMSGLLGGMFGAAAGMWMYNNFFGHSSSSAWGGESHTGGGAPTSEPTDVGAGDPSGAGGDYGDADKGADEDAGGGGGGGDWGGGGDAGGGGGGDWGGGGGGGGGDWGGGGGGDWGGGGGGGDW